MNNPVRKTPQARRPVVMCFSGHDATGGAGIQADIETINSMGCHATSVITAHTVQDTRSLTRYVSQDIALVAEQANAVLQDMHIDAFKIGMHGSPATIGVIADCLARYPDRPVILDPVLSAGGGGEMSDAASIEALQQVLMPLTTVITPNSQEARRLAPTADTLTACAEALQDAGCEYVLITGGDEDNESVVNTLYSNHRVMETFHWSRLPGSFHGSGCTLAAAIAALLAHGLEPYTAIHEAQDYTWQTLEHAMAIGKGQLIPHRLFWADDD